MNEKLAKEVIRCVHSIGKHHPHKQINDSVRGENMALGFIKSEGGSTYPKDIELAMGISSARVAAIIKKLEQRELVTRTGDKIDRRKTLVSLTEKGEKIGKELYSRHLYFYNFHKLQYQFVHFFATLAKISALVLKYMSRLGLAYSF